MGTSCNRFGSVKGGEVGNNPRIGKTSAVAQEGFKDYVSNSGIPLLVTNRWSMSKEGTTIDGEDRNSYETLLPTPLFFTARHREKAGNKPGER